MGYIGSADIEQPSDRIWGSNNGKIELGLNKFLGNCLSFIC